jgi:hypothetical protein
VKRRMQGLKLQKANRSQGWSRGSLDVEDRMEQLEFYPFGSLNGHNPNRPSNKNVIQIPYQRRSLNTVRRSLPAVRFVLRILLRSAPLRRSYRDLLSGRCSILAKRRRSEPVRVPPLSIKAIRLSRPLIAPVLVLHNLHICIIG